GIVTFVPPVPRRLGRESWLGNWHSPWKLPSFAAGGGGMSKRNPCFRRAVALSAWREVRRWGRGGANHGGTAPYQAGEGKLGRGGRRPRQVRRLERLRPRHGPAGRLRQGAARSPR